MKPENQHLIPDEQQQLFFSEMIDMKNTINIGEDDFRTIREAHDCYVDKTGFLEDFINSRPKKVSLFTRPRRFGKSLMLSMMGEFFDCRKNSKEIFDGLKISKNSDLCSRWMNKFPVIRLKFKGIDGNDYQKAYDVLKDIIRYEFSHHEYLLENHTIPDSYREDINAIIKNYANDLQIERSIFNLSYAMHIHYGIKPIILIDEYDIPLTKAYLGEYYKDMIGIVRNIFDHALKSNENMNFAILTGCLRISSESLFTGLNNIKYYDLMSPTFADAFGFTEEEVHSLLKNFEMEGKFEEVQAWYDGYHFGKTAAMYNPWSILNYIDDHLEDMDREPESYWMNTSGNDIAYEILEKNSELVSFDIDNLLKEKCINKFVDMQSTYADLKKKTDSNFWSIMYATGYVTTASDAQLKNSNLQRLDKKTPLVIPNREVHDIWERQINAHLEEAVAEYRFDKFNEAFWNCDEKTVENELNEFMLKSTSSFDVGEYIYQMMMLTILSGRNEAKSNREAGAGRYDISVCDRDDLPNRAAIVEIKKASNPAQLDVWAQKALKQIADKKYDFDLRDRGCKNILHWGLAFHGKTCRAMVRSISNARACRRLPREDCGQQA